MTAAFKCLVALGLLVMTPSAIYAQLVKYNTGDQMRFGWGYNTLTGQYAGNCTNPVVQSDIQDAGAGVLNPGQLTRWELSSVQDLSAFSEKLDVSASASASFIAGSVSASAQYLRSRSFNTFHQFLYVDAAVANTTRIWTKPTLRSDMQALRHRNPLDFLNRCGDSFVQTITDGGELSAILDVSTSASEDTSSLSVAISGSYATAEARAEMKRQLQQTLLNRQTKVTVLRAGGTGALPSYSAEDLIGASQTFPDVVAKNPVPTLAKLASYDTIDTPVSLTVKQEAYIRPLFAAYRRGMQYSGDLSYLRSHSSEFRTLEITPAAKAAMVAKRGNLEEPKTADLTKWKAYQEALAANADLAFSLLTDSTKQAVLSGVDFTFKDIDKDQADQVITAFELYLDTLGSLARQCQNNPNSGCTGNAPSEPARIPHLVRVFTDQKPWDTAAGPVSIVLDPSWVCKVDEIIGNWRIGDAPSAPILACGVSLPKTVINGHIVTGGFDSYYQDNHGTCTYQFVCYRR